MSDYIKREDAIQSIIAHDAFKDFGDSRGYAEWLLNKAQTIDAEPVRHEEWTPCSEMLPEDFQRVLVTIVNYKGDKVVRVAEYYNWDSSFQVKENHEWWKVGEKGLLAWMPLPKPYEEDDNHETD